MFQSLAPERLSMFRSWAAREPHVSRPRGSAMWSCFPANALALTSSSAFPALVTPAPTTLQGSQLVASPGPAKLLAKLVLLKHTAEQVSVHGAWVLMFTVVTRRVLPAQGRGVREHVTALGRTEPNSWRRIRGRLRGVQLGGFCPRPGSVSSCHLS